MLKKILILALMLNTSYTLPSGTVDGTPRYDSAIILTVAGAICTWFACKNFIKGWSATQEENRQIKILNEMGVKLHKVTKTGFEFGSFVTKESYRIEIPSSFSVEQKKDVEKHWHLLLTNAKCAKKMLGWPAVAALILDYASYIEIIGLLNR